MTEATPDTSASSSLRNIWRGWVRPFLIVACAMLAFRSSVGSIAPFQGLSPFWRPGECLRPLGLKNTARTLTP